MYESVNYWWGLLPITVVIILFGYAWWSGDIEWDNAVGSIFSTSCYVIALFLICNSTLAFLHSMQALPESVKSLQRSVDRLEQTVSKLQPAPTATAAEVP